MTNTRKEKHSRRQTKQKTSKQMTNRIEDKQNRIRQTKQKAGQQTSKIEIRIEGQQTRKRNKK